MIHRQKNGFGWLGPLTQRHNWTDGCIALLKTIWNKSGSL